MGSGWGAEAHPEPRRGREEVADLMAEPPGGGRHVSSWASEAAWCWTTLSQQSPPPGIRPRLLSCDGREPNGCSCRVARPLTRPHPMGRAGVRASPLDDASSDELAHNFVCQRR